MERISAENDILGTALWDYFTTGVNRDLNVNTSYGMIDTYNLSYFFRSAEDFPDLEAYALELCKGKVLEVGAGSGSHALILQEHKKNITTMDSSPGCINVMINRGLRKVVWENVFRNRIGGFDTILMLMNGIGIVEDIKGFVEILRIFEKITNPNAKILFDSTDIAYAFSEKNIPSGHYFGEVKYQFEYKRRKGDWFKWLYLDQDKLFEVCYESNWLPQIMFDGDFGHYLCCLYRKY